MRLTRVYVDAPLAPGRPCALPEHAAGHLLRVLRLGPGDRCVLFNGDGNDYEARIASAGRRDAVVEVLSARALASESPLRIVLLQALARGEKMDWIVQKATELGVAAIVPVSSERSEVRLDAPRADRRVAHWRSVAASACEQSGRARLPSIAVPVAPAQAGTACAPGGLRLLLDPDAARDIRALPGTGGHDIAIAIGPEGGWSPRDRDELEACGFESVRLGPRILRTETAGIAAVAALQSRFGDL